MTRGWICLRRGLLAGFALGGAAVLAQESVELTQPLDNYWEIAEPLDIMDGVDKLFVCFDATNPPTEQFINDIHEALRNAGRLVESAYDHGDGTATELDDHQGPQTYQLAGSWTSQGQPVALSWSFVPDGLTIPNGVGEGIAPSSLFAELDGQFGGNRNLWILQFERSFARWEEISGVSYTRITFGGNDWDDGANWGAGGNANRGDIRIGMKPIFGPNGVLAYNAFPTGSDMVLDSFENWSGNLFQYRFLRNVIMHEHGHGLGFAHVCSNNQRFLMEPALDTSFDGPQHDDLRAVHRNYGDFYEPDNSPGNARDLGEMPVGVTGNVCALPDPLNGNNDVATTSCSIDGDGEQDWMLFSIAQSSLVSIEVIPRGITYDDNPQNANGSCQSGSTTNSEDRVNLELDLYQSDGSTLIASATEGVRGDPELIAEQTLVAGDYYLRVYENFSPNQSQLYRLVFTVTEITDCFGDVDGDGVIDLDDLLVILNNFGQSPATPEDGDLDGDNSIDLDDLLLILSGFGGCL